MLIEKAEVVLTARCSLREFDFARSGGSLEKRTQWRQISLSDEGVKDNVLNSSLSHKSYPGLPGPEAGICTAGSGARFSSLGAGEGAGEGAAESLELARSEPLSLENFT